MDGNGEHHPGGGVSAPRALVAVLTRRASTPPPPDPAVTPSPQVPPAPHRIRPMLMTVAAVCVIAASLSVIGWIHWKVPTGGTYAVVETPPDPVAAPQPPNVRTSPQPLVPLLPPDRTRGARPGAPASHAAKPSGTAPSRPSPRPATGPAGAISGYAGNCLYAPSATDGIPVEMATCDGNPGERWIMATDGTVQLSGKCVTVVGDEPVDGTAVRLSPCTGTAGQQWRFSPGRDLVNPHADKCLDVKDFNAGDNASLQLWTCTGSANQKWAVPA